MSKFARLSSSRRKERFNERLEFYVREQLKDIAEKFGIKISSLGKGLSTGTELEYSDNDTIKNALKNRQ